MKKYFDNSKNILSPCSIQKIYLVQIAMTFQRIITFCFIAMLLMISAGVNDGQFDESNWGRLTELLSHKHMCSWCAGQEDWTAAALNFSQQVLLTFTIPP